MQLFLSSEKNFNFDREKNILFIDHSLANKTQLKQNKIKYRFVNHPWDNKEKFYNDYKYLDTLFDRLMNNFTSNLNFIHKKNFSKVYWETAMGRHIIVLISMIYEQFLIFENLSKYKIDEVILPAKFKNKNIESLLNGLSIEEIRVFIYFFFISQKKELLKINKIFIETDLKKENNSYLKKLLELWSKFRLNKIKKKSYIFFKNIITSTKSLMTKLLWTKLENDVVFLGKTHFTFWDELKFKFFLKSLSPNFDAFNLQKKNLNIDILTRKKIISIKPKNKFEKQLINLLPFLVSDFYIENYDQVIDKLEKNSPLAPKLIFTLDYVKNNRMVADLWVASCKEKNKTKVVCHQHGGGYGTPLFDNLTNFQIKKYSNIFYPYNSITANEIKSKKMPSITLQKASKYVNKKLQNENGKILLTFTKCLTYNYNLSARVNGKKFLDYINFYKKFINNIDEKYKSLLLARLLSDDPWNSMSLLSDIFDKNQISFAKFNPITKKSDMFKKLRDCRLVIHTQDTTAFHETMVANFPTIAVWDPNIEIQSKEGKKFYKKLKNVKIIHECVFEASNFINNNSENINKWWYSKKVQNVRKEFCEKIAYTSDNIFDIWKNELKIILANSN